MGDDTMNPVFDEKPCRSCARKDAALREIAVGRTAADLGCGVAVDTMTAARLCQIARAALAEAAPAAGEGVCEKRGLPAAAHVIPAGESQCKVCDRVFSAPPATPEPER